MQSTGYLRHSRSQRQEAFAAAIRPLDSGALTTLPKIGCQICATPPSLVFMSLPGSA